MSETFLAETKEAICESGHEPNDITFIGSKHSGHRCTWDEFCALANFQYDPGFGAQKIAYDLIIVFSDGSSMWRGEHGGSEWWEFAKPFIEPEHSKPITTLVVPPEQAESHNLSDLN